MQTYNPHSISDLDKAWRVILAKSPNYVLVNTMMGGGGREQGGLGGGKQGP